MMLFLLYGAVCLLIGMVVGAWLVLSVHGIGPAAVHPFGYGPGRVVDGDRP